MRGHLQRRGPDSWRLKVFIGQSNDGKRRYVERTCRGSRADAETALARLVVEAAEGRYVAAAPMTFGELLDRWLAVKRMTVEPSTIRNYEWVARTYIRPVLASRRLGGLRPVEIDQLYTDLYGRGLSPRTVRICHTVIRQSLEQARRWGGIARSPAVDATPPRQLRKEVTPPTVEQVRELLDAATAEDVELGTYLWILTATGCRRGEGCGLRWSDVDLDAGELRIRRAIAMDAAGQPYVKDTKTHQSRRLALNEATVARLKAHRRRARERALALGVRLSADDYLFCDAEGRPWRPDVCTNRFGRLRATLGLEHVRLHDLRHFMATALGDAGLPIATISKRLGHRDAATTLNIYTHALPPTDQLAATYLGDLLVGTSRRTTQP